MCHEADTHVVVSIRPLGADPHGGWYGTGSGKPAPSPLFPPARGFTTEALELLDFPGIPVATIRLRLRAHSQSSLWT